MNKKANTIFDKVHPKMIESTFSYPEFVTACKKISLFHLISFEIQSILETNDHTSHTHS